MKDDCSVKSDPDKPRMSHAQAAHPFSFDEWTPLTHSL